MQWHAACRLLFVINGLPEGYDTYKWKIEKGARRASVMILIFSLSALGTGVHNVYNILQTGVKDHDRNLKSTQTRHRPRPYIYLWTWLFCVGPEELLGDVSVSLPNNQKAATSFLNLLSSFG